MARKPFRALEVIDPDALKSFQAGIRKRYSDEELLDELRACAERLGRSPTMREFAADELVFATHPDDHANWKERGVVEIARDRYDLPVAHVAVDPD